MKHTKVTKLFAFSVVLALGLQQPVRAEGSFVDKVKKWSCIAFGVGYVAYFSHFWNKWSNYDVIEKAKKLVDFSEEISQENKDSFLQYLLKKYFPKKRKKLSQKGTGLGKKTVEDVGNSSNIKCKKLSKKHIELGETFASGVGNNINRYYLDIKFSPVYVTIKECTSDLLSVSSDESAMSRSIVSRYSSTESVDESPIVRYVEKPLEYNVRGHDGQPVYECVKRTIDYEMARAQYMKKRLTFMPEKTRDVESSRPICWIKTCYRFVVNPTPSNYGDIKTQDIVNKLSYGDKGSCLDRAKLILGYNAKEYLAIKN